MLKKIALAGIFAVVSVISFNSPAVNASSVNTAKPTKAAVDVGAPVMRGLCSVGWGNCK